ncbi:MAG: tetratricopeptide repeat protein [Candidatus Omnitrophota bacterium]
MSNIRLSLKKLSTIENEKDIATIKEILDETFLMELAKADLDTVTLAKIEFSAQTLSTTSTVDQRRDIRYFLSGAAGEKKSAGTPFTAMLDNFLTNIAPQERKIDKETVRRTIQRIKDALPTYKGDNLQNKLLEIGRSYILLKEFDNAQVYLAKATEVSPEGKIGLKAKLYAALIYKLQGKYEKAEEIFAQIKGKLSRQMNDFIRYEHADTLNRMGESDKARQIWEEAFQEDPSSSLNQFSKFRVGCSYFYEGGKEQKAYNAFMDLYKSVPDARFRTYIKKNLMPLPARYHREKGFIFLEEGIRLLIEGKYHEAQEQFDIAISFDPTDAVSYSGKALAFYFLNQPQEAKQAASAAEKIAPGNVRASANTGFVYYKLNMLDRAIARYEQVVTANPYSSVYVYNLGTLYTLKENYIKAEKYFVQAIHIDQAYAFAYNNLGYVLWEAGKFSEAKENFLKAVTLRDDYVDALYNLGVVYYTLSNYEESREKFLRVRELRPKFRRTEWYLEQIKKYIGY